MTDRPKHRVDAWHMIKRRAKAIGLAEAICNHTFRATGITAPREQRQRRACSMDRQPCKPETTKLYDRTSGRIRLDEIAKMQL
jgi:hypothetical protein